MNPLSLKKKTPTPQQYSRAVPQARVGKPRAPEEPQQPLRTLR